MTKTIVRLFDFPADALRATTEVERLGIPHSDISLVANNSEGWYDEKGIRHDRIKDRDGDGRDDRVEGAEKGAGTGGLLGAGAGLLAGLGMLAIPGLGPVVAAGWLASTAAGAAAGAVAGGAAGGLLGALGKDGVSEKDAHVYADGVRRGGSLLSIRAPDARVPEIEDVLARFNATEAGIRASSYNEDGWKGFDAAAPAYNTDQIAGERLRYPLA